MENYMSYSVAELKKKLSENDIRLMFEKMEQDGFWEEIYAILPNVNKNTSTQIPFLAGEIQKKTETIKQLEENKQAILLAIFKKTVESATSLEEIFSDSVIADAIKERVFSQR